MKFKNQKGFSIVELMIVVSIFAILAAIAIPALLKYQRDFKFWDYASQMEYLTKYAKIVAMERTTNVGVCVSGSTLTIWDIGTGRPSSAAASCTGTAIKTMTVTDSYVTLAGSSASFDPRGVTIWSGNTCVYYNNKYTKMCFSKASVRRVEGSGGCTPCS